MATDRVYWDTMVFVYRCNRHPDYIDVLEQITRLPERGDILIVTSSFTTVETAKLDSIESHEEQEEIIEGFFENDFIRLIPIDRIIAKKARQIMREFPGVKGKDAVHIATACMTPGVFTMHSYDDRILNKNGKLSDCVLTIERPKWITQDAPGQLSIDDMTDAPERVISFGDDL